MKLLDSLLDAIVRLEGDALVMHVGEKPYVVTASSSMNAYRGPLAWGQVELSSRVLTFDAVSSMLGQILPADQQLALTEFGAIEHEIPSPVGIADRFTVVAARGGEDVWVELRRRPLEAAPAPAAEAAPAPAETAHVAEPASAPVSEPVAAPVAAAPSVDAADQGAAELEGIEISQDPGDVEEPAAHVELDAPSSIVVAIPGQDAQEIALNAVPDHAIQIVDDEPQDVPTEEEVDAMLAATAGVILTSGLGEVIDDGAVENAEEIAGARGAEEMRGDAGDEDEIVLEVDMGEPAPALALTPAAVVVEPEAAQPEASEPHVPLGVEYDAPMVQPEAVIAAPIVEELPVAVEALAASADVPAIVLEAPPAEEPPMVAARAEPPFELSPPPLEIAVGDAAPEVEAALEPPAGTPLFSPEAELAATAGVATMSEPGETHVISEAPQEPVIEFAQGSHEVVAEPFGQVEPIAQWEPVAPEVAAFVRSPVDAVLTQPEPALWQPAPPQVWAPQIPAYVEPQHVESLHVEPPAFGEAPSHVEPPAWSEPHMAAVLPTVNEDMNPISQGAESAVSEPMPPIEAPSVPEMTMEVTPELGQQEAPAAQTAGEAAASKETAAPAAQEPALAADRFEPPVSEAASDARYGVVVPLARTPIKPEVVPVPFTPSEDAALMHTLRIAAARGASTVYVVAQSKPMIRIDGEIGPLESEPTLTAADVDRLIMELAPPRRRDALQNGPVEWLCDVPEIGRVRCLTFRDHRGPGVLFRMFPPRAISADQLGLTPEVQALCQQSDGLVLVTGARASGKSTLLNSFVDVINRTRSDHLITVESQIGFVHESRRSFISQRETRGDAELAATYARAALREDPDVMMIEDLKSADLVAAALEAAESGRLVLASVPAASTIAALERLIEVFPAERRAKARSTLATALRGVIAQVLLRRVTGGRIAAREILLNTPAVSQIVLEGKMFQLPVALDSGRRHGMVPLTDSLAGHVRAGTVNVAEAYRKALDRAALVALLKRDGVDTSFAERLA